MLDAERRARARELPEGTFFLRPSNRLYLAGEATLNSGGAGSSLGWGLLLLGFGLLGVGLTGPELLERWSLHRRGVVVDAWVASAFTERARGGSPYRVRYRFYAGDSRGGRSYDRLGVPSAEAFARAQRERRIRVVYDPAAPERSRIVNPGGWVKRVLPPALSLLVALAGLGLGVRGARLRRVIARGELVAGELTRATTRPGGAGLRLSVEYRFTARDGRQRRGRARAVRNDIRGAQLPAAGTPCAVLHLPRSRAHLLL